MKPRGLSLAMFLAIVVSQAIALAQDVKVDNPTLRQALDAMSPGFVDQALSAVFVRTTYLPEPMDADASSAQPDVQRTVISEVLVGSSSVRESVCDARMAKDLVKQYAYHYSKTGQSIKLYDSRKKVGMISERPETHTNIISLLSNPHAATNSGRFISRAMPVLLSRFDGATVTSETECVTSAGQGIELKGEYRDSDPERYFEVVVLPGCNYAIAALVEYDRQKRVLTEMSAADFRRVAGTSELWLPHQTLVRRYRRDDYEGNTVQLFKLDILEPKIVAVREDDFSFAFPADARKVDQVSKVGDVLGQMDGLARDTVDEMLGELNETLSDKQGQAIVSRARAAYEHEKEERGMELEMPEALNKRRMLIIAALSVGCLAVLAVLFVSIRRRKKRKLCTMDGKTE